MEDLKVIVGRSNPLLGGSICEHLGISPAQITLENFADGEIHFQIHENIRGTDVFIIQSTIPPAEHIVELLLMVDAARRASARRITVVMPYFGYARQDRKDRPRVPISSKLIASLIERAGTDRVLTMDLHSAQIQGFFDIPVDHLVSDVVFDQRLLELMGNNDRMVIVSPDVGGVKRIERIAENLHASIAIVYKRRDAPNRSKALTIVGDVANKIAVIRDDIVDTGGTLVAASELIMKSGAVAVYSCATHPLLSGDAIARLGGSPLKKLLTTNTIALPDNKLNERNGFIEVLSVAPLFAAAIRNIHLERSISVLFKQGDYLKL